MVLTVAQRNAFFSNQAQLGIVAATRAQLQTEGITDEMPIETPGAAVPKVTEPTAGNRPLKLVLGSLICLVCLFAPVTI